MIAHTRDQKGKWLCVMLVFLCIATTGRAAITISISPDGNGGTIYAFSQTAANPTLPVAFGTSGGFWLDLPPGMFDANLHGDPGSSDISGSFEAIAKFRDAGSGLDYGVAGLSIASNLSAAAFTFDPVFSPGLGQSAIQLDLILMDPRGLGISPQALVSGTHSTESALFGTVTVHVIPEPSCLILLGTLALARRYRAS